MVNAEFIDRIFQQYLPRLSGKFTIRKLSQLAKLSYDATYRHVHFLVKEGSLNEEKVGAYSNISVNFDSESARKIIERISMKKTQDFLKKDVVLKKLLVELVTESNRSAPNELLSIVLYGSYAKGTQTQNSDIDVLFLVSSFGVSGELERTSSFVGKRYGKPVSPLVTTPVEFGKMLKSEKPMVAHEIFLDGIILFGLEKYYSIIFKAVK